MSEQNSDDPNDVHIHLHPNGEDIANDFGQDLENLDTNLFDLNAWGCGRDANIEAVEEGVGSHSLRILSRLIQECETDGVDRDQSIRRYINRINIHRHIAGASYLARALWTGLNGAVADREYLIPRSRRGAAILWQICANANTVVGRFYTGVLNEYGLEEAGIERNLDEAVRLYETIYDGGTNPWILLRWGMVERDRGHGVHAQELLEEYENELGGQRVNKELGDLHYFGAGDTPANFNIAIDFYNDALNEGGRWSFVCHHRLGNILSTPNLPTHNVNTAHEHYHSAYGINPKDPKLLYSYSDFLVSNIDDDFNGPATKQAIGMLREGVRQNHERCMRLLLTLSLNSGKYRNCPLALQLALALFREEPLSKHIRSCHSVIVCLANKYDISIEDPERAMSYIHRYFGLLEEDPGNDQHPQLTCFVRYVLMEILIQCEEFRNIDRLITITQDIDVIEGLQREDQQIHRYVAIKTFLGHADENNIDRELGIEMVQEQLGEIGGWDEDLAFISNNVFAHFLQLQDNYLRCESEVVAERLQALFVFCAENGDYEGLCYVSNALMNPRGNMNSNINSAITISGRIAYKFCPENERSSLTALGIEEVEDAEWTDIQTEQHSVMRRVREMFNEVNEWIAVEELLRLFKIYALNENHQDLENAHRALKLALWWTKKYHHGCIRFSRNFNFEHDFVEQLVERLKEEKRSLRRILSLLSELSTMIKEGVLAMQVAEIYLLGNDVVKQNKQRGILIMEKASKYNQQMKLLYGLMLVRGTYGVTSKVRRGRDVLQELASNISSAISQDAVVELSKIALEEARL